MTPAVFAVQPAASFNTGAKLATYERNLEGRLGIESAGLRAGTRCCCPNADDCD